MKLIPSELQLTKFVLMNFEFRLTSVPDKKTKSSVVFKDYDVDLDIAWKKANSATAVFCKIQINNKEKKPGYCISAEGVGFFELENIQKPGTQKDALLKFSAPGIVLQELRAIIKNNTLLAPLGSYMLPTINITEQVNLRLSRTKEKRAVSSAKNKK